MPGVNGSYWTRRDGGLEYFYEAHWRLSGRDISWSARVSRKDKSAGRVRGVVANGNMETVEADIIAAIQNAIERKIGVE
jgi:hypothetical protein